MKTRIDFPLGGRPQVVFYDDPNQETIRFLEGALRETKSHINHLHHVNRQLNDELATQVYEIDRNRSELEYLQNKVDKMEYERSLDKKASELQSLIEKHGMQNLIAQASWSGGFTGLLSQFIYEYLFPKYFVQSENYDSVMQSVIEAYHGQVHGRGLVSDYLFFAKLALNSTIDVNNQPTTWDFKETYPYRNFDSENINMQVLNQKYEDMKLTKIQSLSRDIPSIKSSLRTYDNVGNRSQFVILFALIGLQVFFQIDFFPSQQLLLTTAVVATLEFTRSIWAESLIFVSRFSYIAFLFWNLYGYFDISSFLLAFQTLAIFILVLYTFFIDIQYNSEEAKITIAQEKLDETRDVELTQVQNLKQEQSDLIQIQIFLHNKVAALIEASKDSSIEIDVFFSDPNRENNMPPLFLHVFDFLSIYRTYPSQPTIDVPKEILASTILRNYKELVSIAYQRGIIPVIV